MSVPLLKATDLKVSYGNHAPLFYRLNFSLSAGEHLGISGPSGSGKTSLLRLCAGLFGLDHNPLVSGKLLYDDLLDLISSPPINRLAYRRDIVSMITENPRAGLHPQRTVLGSWKHYNLKDELYTSLKMFGIDSLDRIANSYPHQLSGGEAQRVRLAFALSKQPKLLLLESPTAALDQDNASMVWEHVLKVKELGLAVLHVDHNLSLIDSLADQRIQLGEELSLKSFPLNTEVTIGGEVLAATDMSITYNDFDAVKGLDLTLNSGEFVALLGPSGVGKSSVGKALAGIQPARGTLRIEGEATAFAKTPYADVDTRVQYIWQEPRLSMNPRFSVATTLKEAIGSRSITPIELLKFVDLDVDKLSQNVLSLSTGEQQRLAIARALAVQPKVLVCDEITSGLDTQRAHYVLQTLNQLRRELGIAILFITHNEELASKVANRSVRMS